MVSTTLPSPICQLGIRVIIGWLGYNAYPAGPRREYPLFLDFDLICLGSADFLARFGSFTLFR
jgi:hypothetical protein